MFVGKHKLCRYTINLRFSCRSKYASSPRLFGSSTRARGLDRDGIDLSTTSACT